MPNWITNCLHLPIPADVRTPIIEDAKGPSSCDEGDGVITWDTADGGVDIIIKTKWEPPVEWARELSARHLGVTMTLGWVGGVGDEIGWRSFRDGELVAEESLDMMAWETEHEWAVMGWEMFQRVGIESLLDDCDDDILYPGA